VTGIVSRGTQRDAHVLRLSRGVDATPLRLASCSGHLGAVADDQVMVVRRLGVLVPPLLCIGARSLVEERPGIAVSCVT